MLAVRSLLLFLSFAGLCAAIRVRFRLNEWIAPAAAACSTVVLLMAGGMLKLLLPVCLAVYALGFAGLVYAYAVKRQKPSLPVLLIGALYTAVVVLRFGGTKLFFRDEFSHWALVVKHMLQKNAFPDASAGYVRFQAYPLGSACFLYYVGRATENSEGVYYVAHYLLHGILFLPVCAEAVEKRKYRMLPCILGAYLFLLHTIGRLDSILIDYLLAFFGAALAAIFLFYRDEPRKQFLVMLPCALAVVTFKNSGLFFAAVSALAILFAGQKKKYGVWLLVLSVAFFACWSLHVKLTFPAGLETKHAVSVTAYWRELTSKGIRVILRITKAFVIAFLKPQAPKILCFVFSCICASVSFSVSGRRAVKPILFSCAVYIAWTVSVYIMYLVSMPVREAVTVAAFKRYNETGLLTFSVLMFVQALSCLLERGGKLMHAANIVGLLTSAAIVALYFAPVIAPKYSRLFDVGSSQKQVRTALCDSIDRGYAHEGGTYLIYYDAEDGSSPNVMYGEFWTLKYDLMSEKLYVVEGCPDSDECTVGTWWGQEKTSDPEPFVMESIGSCDACLILSADSAESRAFREIVERYAGEIPIYDCADGHG